MTNSINILKPSVCFEVQKIIGISTDNGSCKTYQVEWAPSWISGVHLVGCEDLIEQFEHEQKDKQPNIKVEMFDGYLTQDGVVFDDAMEDENQANEPPEEQLRDSHSNVDVNVQLVDTGLDISHVNHPCVYPDDENYKNNTNDKVLPTDSSFETEDENNTEQSDTPNDTDLQSFQTETNRHNDGSSKDERIIISFQSEELPSDNINATDYCQDSSTNIKTTSVIGQSNNLGHTDCPKPPPYVRYFSKEGTIHALPPEPVNENERAQINNKLKKTFMCHICCKTFPNYYNLKIHSKIHSAPKYVYQCNVCSEKCTSQINLQKHELTHTEGEYSCNTCKARFSDIVKLQTHLCPRTTRPRPYKCIICEKAFQDKCDLRRHMRVHTGERPFKCNICQKQFKTEHYVKKHMMKTCTRKNATIG